MMLLIAGLQHNSVQIMYSSSLAVDDVGGKDYRAGFSAEVCLNRGSWIRCRDSFLTYLSRLDRKEQRNDGFIAP